MSKDSNHNLVGSHCSTMIPEGVYYRVEHANFYRISDCCGMGMVFYEQWYLRSKEFPSIWEIQDHLESYRGDEVAHSAEEAIVKYAVKHSISSKDITHWRAIRR